jgi:stress response protein YsnF
MKGQTVIGIFDYGVDAQMAAQQLMSSGIPKDQIDIAVRGAHDKRSNQINRGSTTPTNNNINPVNSTNAGPNARTDNDITFFGSLFEDRNESSKYSEVAQHGSIVTVHTQSADQAKRAAEVLDKYGAIDVDKRAEQYKSMPRQERPNWINNTMPIIQEEMQVGKRQVETGGVHLRSRIIEKPVEEHLRLREEHVHVERHAVNRPANEKDFASFKQGETEIIEHAEVPVVNKEARVVEEVRLNKETTERDETVRDTVRRKDVEIDDIKKDDLNRDNRTGPDTNRNI